MPAELGVRATHGLRTHRHQVRTGGQAAGLHVDLSDGGAQAATDTVAHHGGADAPSDGVRDPDLVTAGDVGDRHRTAPRAPSVAAERIECRTVTDPADQAESRARPFWRRARTILRPARLLIR